MKKLLISLLILFLFLGHFYLQKAEASDDAGIKLFVGLLELGIGIWGYTQNSTYGYVVGSFFLLSGTIQIVTIKF